MDDFSVRLRYLTDPEVFEVNRLPPRSDHMGLDGDGKPLPAVSLRGEWGFGWYETPERVDRALLTEGQPPFRMDVPGHLQLAGFGQPQYVNTQYPWDGRFALTPPALPPENPTGLYVKCFDLPEAMRGWHVRVRFDGAEPCLFVYLNGRFVGYGEDSFTPSEFDLTPYLRQKGNRLCVIVPRYTSGSWLEDQDFWRFSGLFRDVTLLSEGDVWLEDAHIIPLLNADLTAGSVTARLTVKSRTAGPARLCLSVDTCRAGAEINLDQSITSCEITLPMRNPLLWSAETPALYTAAVTITDGTGGYLAGTRVRFGFRRFEKRDGLLLLNGKRVVFRGVNRHEWDPAKGRAIDEAAIRRDIIAMKQNNVNAVRCSHYPNQSAFYRLCDEFGLYVIDETNLETHGTWMVRGEAVPSEKTLPGDNPAWKEAVLDRGKSMLERDKNHPCILFWSCGNESCGGSTLFALAEWFRARDATRLVHYEGIFWDRRYPGTSDVESQMYTPPAKVKAWLAEHPGRPFLLCEYAHAMGNSSGNMEEYTLLSDVFPAYQGGFIWDWLDQGLALPGADGKGRSLPQSGLAGARPTDGYFCGNGLLFADRTPSPKLAEVKYLYQPLAITCDARGVTIQNRMLFSDTGKYLFRWTLQEDGLERAGGAFTARIGPGETAATRLPHADCPGRGECILTCAALLAEDAPYAPAGHEAAFGQGVLRPGFRRKAAMAPARYVEGDVNYGFSMGAGDALVHRQLGKLYSLRKGGLEYLLGPASACFWRAPTDNDLGFLSPLSWGAWKLADLYQYPVSMEADGENASVTVAYAASMGRAFTVTYRFYQENALDLTLTLPPQEGSLPCAGFTFQLPPAFSRLRWYGNGMAEAGADRRNARRIGVYESTVADQYVPYLHPQDCGDKTDVRYFEVRNPAGDGLRFSGDGPLTVSALPYTSHELEQAGTAENLPPVTKTVVTVSLLKSGVGGDDSWGAPIHEPYLARPERGFSGRVRVELL